MFIPNVISIEPIKPNRWYKMSNHRPVILRGQYPSPHNILRTSLGISDYTFKTETVNSNFIRAAAIFKKRINYSSCLDVPWAMIYRNLDYDMVIVSCENHQAWILHAQQLQAQAWLRGHNQTQVYCWRMPDLDQTNPIKYQHRQYDRSRVISSLRTVLTYREIAQMHSISENTVARIAIQEGISRKRERKKHG